MTAPPSQQVRLRDGPLMLIGKIEVEAACLSYRSCCRTAASRKTSGRSSSSPAFSLQLGALIRHGKVNLPRRRYSPIDPRQVEYLCAPESTTAAVARTGSGRTGAQMPLEGAAAPTRRSVRPREILRAWPEQTPSRSRSSSRSVRSTCNSRPLVAHDVGGSVQGSSSPLQNPSPPLSVGQHIYRGLAP